MIFTNDLQLYESSARAFTHALLLLKAQCTVCHAFHTVMCKRCNTLHALRCAKAAATAACIAFTCKLSRLTQS